MSEVVGVGPKVVKKKLRAINKVQCYLIRETKEKEKRFLLSYIISV